MKSMKPSNILLFLAFIAALTTVSCSDNIQNPESSTLVYSKPGLVDSLVGTCSTYLVRNFIIDTLDFSGYTSGKLEMNSLTDGDLSEISLFFFNADTASYLVKLNGKEEINSASPRTFDLPSGKKKFYLRMKLYSSVCTGQFFSLRIRDLNIYGVK